MGSKDNFPLSPPRWINPVFMGSALLALFSCILVAYSGWEGALHHRAGMVADVSINLKGRVVREHCTTCHPEGGKALSQGEIRASQPHPDISSHSIEELGCTGCHLGEGMAMEEEISHGLRGKGARKILAGTEVQGSCYRCHEIRPLKGAEKAWRGYELYTAKPCDLCHYAGILGGGGHFGPDLSNLGDSLGIEKIQEAITDPRKEPKNSIMPRFPMPSRDAALMSLFLKGLLEQPFHVTPMQISARERLHLRRMPGPRGYPSGTQILETKKCLGCHMYKEKDGAIAPDLTYLDSIRDRAYIAQFLRGPRTLVPDSAMPTVNLTDRERDVLVAFIAETHGVHLEHNEPQMLYMMLCQRCHAANGDGHGIIQPNLATFPRAFKENRDFFRTISDERLVKSTREGVPGTSMPAFGVLLSENQVKALLDLVFQSFVGIDRKDKVSAPALPARPLQTHPQDAGLAPFKRRCSRCHGLAGTGKGPEYLRHLPRPRNLTNRAFISSAGEDRIARAILQGVPGTAMPVFREKIDPEDLWRLVATVRRFAGIGEDVGGRHGS